MFKIVGGFLKGTLIKIKYSNIIIILDKIFPKTYLPNGYIDILKPSIILKSRKLHGNKILPFITNQTNDIDLNDFKRNKIGFIQGRLTKQKKIQQFPFDNWKEEII